MTIDGYSFCPGGTGKKIKFCCPDSLPELEKIHKMLDGQQFLACRQHLERLMEQPANRDRQCLLALYCTVLQALEEREAAAAVAREFCEKHPNNPLAQALFAASMLAAGDATAAMQAVLQGVALCEKAVPAELVDAIGMVAEAMASRRQWLPAARLVVLRAQMERGAESGAALQRVWSSPDFPLLLKDLLMPVPPPEDFPDHERLQEVQKSIARARWSDAEKQLVELRRVVGDDPWVLKTLAAVQSWLGRGDAAAETMRKIAASSASAEEAAEWEARAMLCSMDPLKDSVDIVAAGWTVTDFERMQMALLSNPRVRSQPVDPNLEPDGGPPPRGLYLILDRPPADSLDSAKPQELALPLGAVFLFGKQTDREAELRAPLLPAPHVERLDAFLREIGGDALGPAEIRAPLARRSATEILLDMSPYWAVGTPPAQIRAAATKWLQHAVLQLWPQAPLGVLDGKKPAEAAADPALRSRLSAVILVLQDWLDQRPFRVETNALRIRLGLPALGPIETAAPQLTSFPLARLTRVIVEKLKDEDLLLAFRRSTMYGVAGAVRMFGAAIIGRPSLAKSPERAAIIGELVEVAETAEAAMQWVEQGRKEAEAAGKSSAPWDLKELDFHFATGNGDAAGRMMEHVYSAHYNEPGVADALMNLLVSVGILHPDGTPAYPMEGGHDHAHAEAAAPEAAPARSGLWTPENPTSSGGGKLWVPS